MSSTTSTFADEIARLVKHCGGTEIATARFCGVSQPTVHRWRSGGHGVSAAIAIRIEQLTGGEFRAADLCPALAPLAEMSQNVA